MKPISDLYELFLNATGITTDSRKVEKGSIFFALKGEHFDGNKFAEQTLLSGAAYAVVDDISLKAKDRFIHVENVLITLQQLANYHRKQFQIPIIAITGSNGKTTSKELLAAIFQNHYRTHYTKGNLNNHIGVPITLLNMPLDTEIAVIEMGANHIGEIAALCNIVEPSHGVITNVGKAHLEGFGGFEGVKKAKAELYGYLHKRNGVAFINLDEPFLKDLARNLNHIVFYHQSEDPDPLLSSLETKLVSATPVVKIAFLSDNRTLEIEAKSNLFGDYNFNNIQTAVAIGRYFKVPADKIKAAVESYVSTNNRSQLLVKETNTFIMDAYNANPTSMRIAINNIDMLASDHKMVILGDMLELGEYSMEEHQSIFNHALSKSFDQIIFVGKEFAKIVTETDQVHYFKDVEELRIWFYQKEIKNTLILLKGSRGVQLEKLLN
ncbi:MAG: UDP-N-acetylmuramoyl-tripeptide--D-alanyl-D-alanine ligase [Saprospiraceae bacterium]|jgi:UDP-N-acetylmuramoyl-tripeptide--D-alanyl-D-alanine ligase